jgi:ABC-type dipeptide/oligopeptide/nickel transport system ATPase component
MAVILITHNFGIVSGFASRVLVMYRGKIVEQGPTEDVLRHPQHPYTRALIDCIPRLGANEKRLKTIDHAAINAAG